jgi:hypothetical protein
MGLLTTFQFRNKTATCTIHIDSSESPCYLFIDLNDRELIQEFGEEITVKTDFERSLPKNDDYSELVLLREAIFDGAKHSPEFLARKSIFAAQYPVLNH